MRREAVPAGAAGSSALDLDFVERVLDLRVTRLEAAASSTQDLHKQLATLNKQVLVLALALCTRGLPPSFAPGACVGLVYTWLASFIRPPLTSPHSRHPMCPPLRWC